MSREEKKPYNPYHLAGGYVAPTLPDKKTIAVFKCYCNHTDFMGGSVSISIETVMRETGYSHRAVCYADAVLTSLGRITKKSRGIGGQRGGRQSSITRVYCTEAELKAAGANDENYFGRGGSHGLFKVQTPPIQSAKRVYSKCKQDGFKVQRDALEPLKSEPFIPQPIRAEPLEAGVSQSQPLLDSFSQGMKGQTKSTPGAAGNPILPVGEKPVVKVPLAVWSPALFLSEETWDKLKKFGCPPEALAQINKLKHWSNALNNTTNVITAYETLAMKDNGTATKLYKMWMPKRVNLSAISGDDDFDFAPMNQSEREALQAEAAMPPEVRKLKAARDWWWSSFYVESDSEFGGDNDNYEKRQKYIQFPQGYKSWQKVSDEQVLAAYDVAMEEHRQYELEEYRKLCEKSLAKAKGVAV